MHLTRPLEVAHLYHLLYVVLGGFLAYELQEELQVLSSDVTILVYVNQVEGFLHFFL